jgi:hypothetical protein
MGSQQLLPFQPVVVEQLSGEAVQLPATFQPRGDLASQWLSFQRTQPETGVAFKEEVVVMRPQRDSANGPTQPAGPGFTRVDRRNWIRTSREPRPQGDYLVDAPAVVPPHLVLVNQVSAAEASPSCAQRNSKEFQAAVRGEITRRVTAGQAASDLDFESDAVLTGECKVRFHVVGAVKETDDRWQVEYSSSTIERKGATTFNVNLNFVRQKLWILKPKQ